MEHEGMVHALEETWRVLRPSGLMVDLRPLSEEIRVEIETAPEARIIVGELDESDWVEDDLAAERAAGEAIGNGWFRLAEQQRFDFRWYFESLDELVDYAGEKWDDRVDDVILTHAAERLAALPETARLCVRKPVHFAIYKKE